MTHVHVPYRYPSLSVDASHERFALDHNRCILCTRCVRVCDEIEGAHTWDVMGRGIACAGHYRPDQPWGRFRKLHRLRQVRAGLPHGRADRKRKSVAEMAKRRQFLPYLTLMREKEETRMSKVRLATVWLDGCSGCHMSLLDIDGASWSCAQRVDVVYSPLVDAKEFPEDVDVALVEGAVSSEHDLELILRIRERTKILVALGDCAVTGNVSAMRNPFSVDSVMNRAYIENVTLQPADAPGTAASAAGALPARSRIGGGGCLRPGLPAPRGADRVRGKRIESRPHAGRERAFQVRVGTEITGEFVGIRSLYGSRL